MDEYWENLNKLFIKTENNMKRNLELTIEQAKKLYAENESMRELLLTSFTKEELEGVVLKDWSELKDVTGYYVTEVSCIKPFGELKDANDYHKNVCATEKQAKSTLAMAQLSQLMKDLGDECNVEWTGRTPKCYIMRFNNAVICDQGWVDQYHFLAFKTREIALAFMKKHDRLIRDYFMLD